jgi:glutaredoxin
MITVYTRNNCPYCDQAKALLESSGVAYETINIEEKPEARTMLMNAGFKSVPQIFRGTECIPGGFQGLAKMTTEEFNTKLKGL